VSDDRKTIMSSVSALDQWETTCSELIRTCPDAVMVYAFRQAVIAESELRSPVATMGHFSAVILRVAFHREIVRRMQEEGKTIEQLEGAGS